MGPGGRAARRAAQGRAAPAGVTRATPGRSRAGAWLAGQNGDHEAERSALEELLAVVPGDDATFERLADLAAQDGEGQRVTELRRRKAAFDAAFERYRELINRPEMTPYAVELARSGEAIGRWYDAAAWWRLASKRDPSFASEAAAALPRLAAADPPATADGRSLAELLGASSTVAPASNGVRSERVLSRFVDQARERGLTFSFENGAAAEHQLPEIMAGGLAHSGFRRRQWLDVYAIQGGPFPPAGQRALRRPYVSQPRQRPL